MIVADISAILNRLVDIIESDRERFTPELPSRAPRYDRIDAKGVAKTLEEKRTPRTPTLGGRPFIGTWKGKPWVPDVDKLEPPTIVELAELDRATSQSDIARRLDEMYPSERWVRRQRSRKINAEGVEVEYATVRPGGRFTRAVEAAGGWDAALKMAAGAYTMDLYIV